MTNRKFNWIMLGANIFVVLAIIGATVGGDRLLKKQSDKIYSQRLENAVLDKQQITLVQAKKDLETYSELQQIAQQIVPQEKDQALTTREIISLANKAGVHISTIGFPSSTLGSPQAAAKSSGSTSSATQTPVTPSITQAKPVNGITGVLALDVSVVSDVTKPTTFSQLVTFLESLENNRRTAQVSQLSITPDSKNSSLLNFTLTVTVYIKP